MNTDVLQRICVLGGHGVIIQQHVASQKDLSCRVVKGVFLSNECQVCVQNYSFLTEISHLDFYMCVFTISP